MRAFSLVELSVVLVILGLLSGGVMAGKSLLRAAKLRTIITDFRYYQTASSNFSDQYRALAGDLHNATFYWGKNNTACPAHTGTADANGTCNGNGDGILTHHESNSNATVENHQFWKQLALAGFIQGSFTGLNSSETAGLHFGTAGLNVPYGKLNNTKLSMYQDLGTGDAVGFAHGFSGHIMRQTGISTGVSGAFLRPAELANIDTKSDDGKPGRGKIASNWHNGCTLATANDQLDTDYNIQNQSIACNRVFFIQSFNP